MNPDQTSPLVHIVCKIFYLRTYTDEEQTTVVTGRLQINSEFCLFDLILYVPSTIFQLNRDGSSWGEPVLS